MSAGAQKTQLRGWVRQAKEADKRFRIQKSVKRASAFFLSYLDSLVKTNFLSLRSLSTMPLECASCTADTICVKRCLACGSLSLRLILTYEWRSVEAVGKSR